MSDKKPDESAAVDDEGTPHKVDEKVQEQAAEERAENGGYD